MSFMEAMKQIKKKKIEAVYLIYGTESYFQEQIKKEIMKVEAAQGNDDVSLYDLEETSIQDVLADAETYPFFGEKKLIIATNPVFLKAKPDKLPFDHDLGALERYLESPPDYSVLIITAPYEKIDERKKVSKLFKKKAMTVICSPVREKETRQWIDNIATAHKIRIDPSAHEILEAELTSNLQLLETEITKLALYVGENGVVTKEIAEKMIAPTSNSSALRLVDAVIAKDLHKAISIFKDLQKMKEEPIALISLLAFQFRTLLSVKLLGQKGYSQFQMQKSIGAHPYVIKIAQSREKQFSVKRLEEIICRLADTDAVMKQGKMEKDLAFELLLYNLIKQPQ